MSRGRGGPATRKGKAVSRTNATQHGLTAQLVPLPTEDAAEWGAFRASLVADLAPVGTMEEVLVDRIAMLAWRLKRIARFESETAVANIAAVEDEVGAERLENLNWRRSEGLPVDVLLEGRPRDVASYAEHNRDRADLLTKLSRLKAKAKVNGPIASVAISDCEHAARELAASTDRIVRSADEVTTADVPDDIALEDFTGWTAASLRRFIAELAADAGVALDELLTHAAEGARRDALLSDHVHERVAAEVRRRQAARTLPPPAHVEKLVRYETSAERSMLKLLHELQRLQAARRGAGLPPVAVDLSVDPGS